jgi:uncharacterized UPF0160 family protein
MSLNKYKNIQLTNKIEKANCVTHSGSFHVDDVISTIFLSKIIENVVLIRVPSTENIYLENKMIYDIGFGEFDHHQKSRNGQRENGIYYSSIGLLWQKFGKNYLKNLKIKNIKKTFEYMDKELIQYIDATDNMQMEYLENKVSPDFLKYCNPEWNENISENKAFIYALKLADGFWNVYIKRAIAEVEAIELILNEAKRCKTNYLVFDKDLPYRKAIKLLENDTIKYIILKSKRAGYDIRTIKDSCRFKDEIVKAENINIFTNLSGIENLIYVDPYGKLCCTKTLDSAIKLIKYNEIK